MAFKDFVHGMVYNSYSIDGNTVKCNESSDMQNQITTLTSKRDYLVSELEKTKISLQAQINMKAELLIQLTATEDTNKAKIADLSMQIDQLNAQLLTVSSAYQALLESKSESGIDWKSLIDPLSYAKLMSYYTKYPNAKIFYTGRTLPGKTTTYDMNVENWAQYGINSPELVSFVKSNHCTVAEVMSSSKVGFHKACDMTILRIKKAINQIYSYDFDKSTTGFDEYWKFALETYVSARISIGSDCDDWAALNYVCCRIAGVPKEMLRIACGYTFTKVGHSTNFYYASDNKWHHVNSTSTLENYTDAVQLPLTGDSSDQLNLEIVWFSYNEDMSWQSFSTTAASNSFYLNKDTHPLLNKIRIAQKE